MKKALTGNGHADKLEVRQAIKTILGMDVKDHNAADSLSLFCAVKMLRQPAWAPRATPLFGGRR